jgi:hypothetical protein
VLVFISYPHEDSTLVGRLTEGLSASGIETFQDTKDVAWGGRITADVQRALERAAGVVVVVSPASVASQWVPYEIGYATALRKPILPFLTHRSLQLPGYLADIRHLSDLDQVGAFIDRVKSIGQTGVVGDRNEVSEAALAAKMIAEIQPQMPALLSEMQDDIKQDTTGLVTHEILSAELAWLELTPFPRISRPEAKGDRPGKRPKGRSIWLGPAAVEIIRSIPRPADCRWLIPGDDPDQPLLEIDKGWARVCKIAGVEVASPKSARHAFRSAGPTAGIAPEHMRELMGHATSEMTDAVYWHANAHAQARAAEAMDDHLAGLLAPAPLPARSRLDKPRRPAYSERSRPGIPA